MGYPAAKMLASTALMVFRSTISRAAGRRPAEMMEVTARPASSSVSKMARRVRVASGTGTSATSTSVANPKHPSDPTKSPTRSKVGASRP